MRRSSDRAPNWDAGSGSGKGDKTREAYLIERDLADRLRAARKEERPRVAREVYAEHFHPEDVASHLSEVARVPEPGGWFGLDTPNRISGPHDISRGFSGEATGLHLKEWTHGELVELLMCRGFDKVVSRWVPGRASRTLQLRPPGPLINASMKTRVERIVSWVGQSTLRRWMARLAGVNGIFLYARRAMTSDAVVD